MKRVGRSIGWFMAGGLTFAYGSRRWPTRAFVEKNTRCYKFSATSRAEALKKATTLLKRLAKASSGRKHLRIYMDLMPREIGQRRTSNIFELRREFEKPWVLARTPAKKLFFLPHKGDDAMDKSFRAIAKKASD